MFNEKVFFDGIRNDPFPGKLTASQVQGTKAIVDYYFANTKKPNLWHLAYELATSFHETGQAMQPVIETRKLSEPKNPTVDQAIARLESSWARKKMTWVKTPYWRKDARGLSWLGRGLPQVTHKTNYARAEKETGIPFTQNPDLMLKLENAVPVQHIGMTKGWFTGNKLSDYLDGLPDSPKALVGAQGAAIDKALFNARRIINSTESAQKVAGYAKAFYVDLFVASV